MKNNIEHSQGSLLLEPNLNLAGEERERLIEIIRKKIKDGKPLSDTEAAFLAKQREEDLEDRQGGLYGQKN